MSERKAAATFLAIACFSAIWGYNWVVMKRALAYAGPLDFAALRNLLGALSLFAVLLVLRRPLAPVATGWTLLLGLLQTAGFSGLAFAALVWGGAGKTAVLTYTMPFWSLLLSRWLLGERIARAQWPPILLAFAGLALVLLARGPGAAGAQLAALLAVGAGFLWAASAVVAKKLRARHQLDLISLTAWQMLWGSLALVALALAVPSRPIEWSAYFVGALVYNVLLATALAWLLWLYVLQRMNAGMAAMATLAIPVIGVLAAALELGERPGAGEAAGMALIGAGLAGLSLLGLRQRA